MRVSVHAADEGGCGYYRLRWPAQDLIEKGHDVILNKEIIGTFVDHPNGRTEVLSTSVPSGADVVVLQRPLHRDVVSLIPNLKAQGIAVVVEIDDDFQHIPANNVAFKNSHPKYNPMHNWNLLALAVKWADLVTVSTPRLAALYGGESSKVRIIPNCVPDWYLEENPPLAERHGIGWTGSIITHPGDLEITRGGLQKTPEPFRVIGTGNGVAKALGLNYEPEATQWLDLQGEYQKAVSTFKVGVVPLTDSTFNQAKSWLKGLEYAAFGVPFIASPTEEYKRLAALGAGKLATRNREWTRLARELLTNEELWREMSEAGREVAKQFTIGANSWRWMEAWEDARVNAALRIAS